MNILISGGTGNVGKILIPLIKQSGHECYILTRSPKSKNDIFWNPTTGEGELPDGIEMNAVVHLAGYSVSNKWTKKQAGNGGFQITIHRTIKKNASGKKS